MEIKIDENYLGGHDVTVSIDGVAVTLHARNIWDISSVISEAQINCLNMIIKTERRQEYETSH